MVSLSALPSSTPSLGSYPSGSRRTHLHPASPAQSGSSPASAHCAAATSHHLLASPTMIVQPSPRRAQVLLPPLAASAVPSSSAAVQQQGIDGQQQQQQQPRRSSICTSVTASTVQAFLSEVQEAASRGVDIIELRLDFLKDFDASRDLEPIMASCPMPYIVTNRPKWEGGNFEGSEAERLATLKYAALKGAPYIDVEYKSAAVFFAGRGEVPTSCKVILSSHNFQMTPPAAELQQLARDMHAAGADVVKIATMANDITDSAAVLSLLNNPADVNTSSLINSPLSNHQLILT
ncbi:type I 3-dehydroquinase-domain-containing protein [Dunaliella salina]|uniref:Type I 3-dehydroquinase-domain-containing protein n=1 Tax=Dunaliella salina TaxID=3046 RepID=A0ABQ7G3H9_DUNSA|nr:type I 3-dehydroquinase-domain-containing protein [Dunaliella salina]|eukprot:KAF5829171.1 type I 3-dehydroquinase-domain-containing protein [Dunaliella salina]